jgi:hypothetical protein
MRVRFAAAVLAMAGLLSVSCGGIIDPSKNTVEPFSGTLAPLGGTVFHIQIGNTGEFSVKITAMSPTPTSIVGAQWAFGANCEQVLQQNGFATLNTPALGGVIQQKGSYCLTIYDVGALSVAQTFTVTVSHP